VKVHGATKDRAEAIKIRDETLSTEYHGRRLPRIWAGDPNYFSKVDLPSHHLTFTGLTAVAGPGEADKDKDAVARQFNVAAAGASETHTYLVHAVGGRSAP
jgi:hypothetical protein